METHHRKGHGKATRVGCVCVWVVVVVVVVRESGGRGGGGWSGGGVRGVDSTPTLLAFYC